MRNHFAFWSAALVCLLGDSVARAQTLSISASPGANSPGLGRIALDPNANAVTVFVDPSGALSITTGNGVFLPGAGTIGTASPMVSTVTATCTGGSACGSGTHMVSITQSGNTGNTATLTSFIASTTAANCTGCTFGTTGTGVAFPLTITGKTGNTSWTATFDVGMTVTFSGTSNGTGTTTIPYTISIN